MRCIELWHFQWPSVTRNSSFKVTKVNISKSIARLVSDVTIGLLSQSDWTSLPISQTQSRRLCLWREVSACFSLFGSMPTRHLHLFCFSDNCTDNVIIVKCFALSTTLMLANWTELERAAPTIIEYAALMYKSARVQMTATSQRQPLTALRYAVKAFAVATTTAQSGGYICDSISIQLRFKCD